MLDTMIYDMIITVPDLVDHINNLFAKGMITILCTHIQDDQLAKIPDDYRRTEISRIKRQHVTTAGAVYGVSKYGGARYGNGSSSGINIDQIRSPSKHHTKDALIATTAAQEADVLVTEDRRFANRVKVNSVPCEVWIFEQFKNYILSIKNISTEM